MTASKTPEIKSHKIESQKNHGLSTQTQGLESTLPIVTDTPTVPAHNLSSSLTKTEKPLNE
jgi:hypothetical protein